ncbi:response regulator transcription factor, partial [Bacillus sp. HC-Mk]
MHHVKFEVDTAINGEDGLFLALQNIYDAILLDVMMPGMDGFEVIQKIRDEKIETPVLFLTARDSLEDRVKGLDFGGDDYIVKPFQAPELKARIRALLRRSGSLTTQQTIRYKGIELFGKDKDVQVDGQSIKLTLKQYELLEYLIQNSGKILMREQIFDRVWGFDSDTTVAIVEIYELAEKIALDDFDKLKEQHEFSHTYTRKKKLFMEEMKLKNGQPQKKRKKHRMLIAAACLLIGMPTTVFGAVKVYNMIVQKQNYEVNVSLTNKDSKKSDQWYKLKIGKLPENMEAIDDSAMKYSFKDNYAMGGFSFVLW